MIKNKIQTPYYLIDEKLLINNLKVFQKIINSTGCKILLAQKAFSTYKVYPIISKYLNGTCCSSLFEAKLAKEYFKGEIHIYSPAYQDYEISEISDICDYIVFNSFRQLNKYHKIVISKNKKIGIRINPEISTSKNSIYDPCSRKSRLGIIKNHFLNNNNILNCISGLHFHTLCEQNVDDLILTLNEIEKNFLHIIKKIKWINFGGGHYITDSNYDVDLLIEVIKNFKFKYNVDVYLEPGEAVVLNTGFLYSKVIDIIENQGLVAILDTSAACHMPDVLEMPYTPKIINGYSHKIYNYKYRLCGPTCLSGDIIGDYSFKQPLQIGQILILNDMAHYTTVKNNMFNGINLPSILLKKINNEIIVLKNFNYNDFKNRL